MSEPEEEQTYSLEEALNAVGFGRFQIQLLIVCGVGYTAATMELILISYLLPQLRKEWGDLTAFESAFLASASFAGTLIGSVFWGWLADKIGRKISFTTTVFLSGSFGLASAFAPSFLWIIFFRFMVGFALGGNLSVDFVLFLEFVPTIGRGFYVSLITLFGVFGILLLAGIAWIVIPRLGWRYFLAICSIPSVIVLFFRAWMPESPRYLCVSGEYDEAERVLQLVSRVNNKQLPQGKLSRFQETVSQKRGSFRDLVTPKLRLTSIIIWELWFCLVFGYYGITIWLPEYLENKGLGSDIYLNFLLIGIAELPGVALTAFLVDRVGRRRCLAACMIGSGVCTLFFGFATSAIAVKIVTCAIYFFVVGAWAIIYLYTPEVYPTYLRSTASGVTSIFSTCAGIISPIIGGALLGSKSQSNRVWIVLGCYTTAFLVGGISALFLPMETNKTALQDINTVNNNDNDDDTRDSLILHKNSSV